MVALRTAGGGVAEDDHSDADCFVCVILSHGEEGVVYGTDGKVPLDKLLGYFKGDICPSLAGKPKLFFIQACRGRRYDFGTVLGEDQVDALPVANTRKIPTEADFLIAYSVVPGHFSWRNNVDGSWFVQALCRVFEQHGSSIDLLQMMTLVNKIVAYDFESCTDDNFTSQMKQVPCIVSMLTKQVFFKPKY
ncbi:Caspase-7 [Lamellibrachia satsuma]|nr:Caspase-7 [Lamellibrachia satsuma]